MWARNAMARAFLWPAHEHRERLADLAIMLIDKKSRAAIQMRALLELPLVLLVHRESKLTRGEELWKRDKIEDTLVSFPRTDPVHACFQRGLERVGVEWFCGIEVTSERLIEHYVASGCGIGLAVAVPGFKPLPQLRSLPLDAEADKQQAQLAKSR